MNKKHIKYWLKGITIIRLVVWPVINLTQFQLQRKYLKSRDAQYLKSLRNIHRGERCFVIGNGPSLKAEDLDRLMGEISFASNRIFCIYPKTKWRPTYYICVDPYALESGMDSIKNEGTYEKFINFAVKKKETKANEEKYENIHYIYLKSNFSIKRGKEKVDCLSDNVSHYFTQNATVTVNAIEFAVHMGFSEMYLLGVDNNYAIKLDEKGKVYKEKSMRTSYFEGVKGEEFVAQPVDYMNRSYMAAKKFAEENGVKIYNATRGGKLEVFERVDFDELMNQSICRK